MPIHAMRGHRELILLGSEGAAFAGDAEFAFDGGVVRAEIFVGDGPIGADAFGGVGAEIVLMKAGHDAEPGERAARLRAWSPLF